MKGIGRESLIIVAVISALLLMILSGNFLSAGKGITETFGFRALAGTILSPGGSLKVAAYSGEDCETVREAAVALIELNSMEPYNMSISPKTSEITESDISKLEEIIAGREISTTFFYSMFSNCQSWLTFADVGAENFEVNKDITNKYYAGMTSSFFRPDKVSEILNEHMETVELLCGSGCENSRTCAGCADDAEMFRTLSEKKPYAERQEVEDSMRLMGCGESCAQVCHQLYPGLKILIVEGITEPDAKKAFISQGISLN